MGDREVGGGCHPPPSRQPVQDSGPPQQRLAYGGCLPSALSSAQASTSILGPPISPGPPLPQPPSPRPSPPPTLQPPTASRATYPGAAPQELRHLPHGASAGRDGLVGLLLRCVPEAGQGGSQRRERTGRDGGRGRPQRGTRQHRGNQTDKSRSREAGVACGGRGNRSRRASRKHRARDTRGQPREGTRIGGPETDRQTHPQMEKAATRVRKEGENDRGELGLGWTAHSAHHTRVAAAHPACKPCLGHGLGPLVWGSAPAPPEDQPGAFPGGRAPWGSSRS